YRVRPSLTLPWLTLAAACSSASPVSAGPGATDGGADGGGPEQFFTPDAGALDWDADLGLACTGASPSFTTSVAPILEGCSGGELCHGFPSPPYLYGQLVDVVDECDAGVIVSPGSLQGSYLLHKLTGIALCPKSEQMPPNRLLPQQDIQTIADWVCSGAPND